MNRRGFSSVIILIVIVVVFAILGTWYYLSYTTNSRFSQSQNPTISRATSLTQVSGDEQSKEYRDAKRVSDFTTLHAAIELYLQTANPKPLCADTKTVYASALLTPPSGWKVGAHMGATTTDGNGWLPIDFKNTSEGSLLDTLPVDPVNDPSHHLVYLFVCNPATAKYELDSVFESKKYNTGGAYNLASTDYGDDPAVYEVGNGAILPGDKTLTLVPENFWNQ